MSKMKPIHITELTGKHVTAYSVDQGIVVICFPFSQTSYFYCEGYPTKDLTGCDITKVTVFHKKQEVHIIGGSCRVFQYANMLPDGILNPTPQEYYDWIDKI